MIACTKLVLTTFESSGRDVIVENERAGRTSQSGRFQYRRELVTETHQPVVVDSRKQLTFDVHSVTICLALVTVIQIYIAGSAHSYMYQSARLMISHNFGDCQHPLQSTFVSFQNLYVTDAFHLALNNTLYENYNRVGFFKMRPSASFLLKRVQLITLVAIFMSV